MVAKRATYQVRLSLLLFLVVTIPLLLSSSLVHAQDATYHIEHEWAKIWINADDGSIDLLYDIELVCDSRTISQIDVGQPAEDFTLGECRDSVGNTLNTEKIIEDDYYAVRLYLRPPLESGRSVRFTVTTNVRGMIYLDQENPGNVGMLFIPTWWEVRLQDLRLLIVFPDGVQRDEVKTLRGMPYDNAYYDPEEEGRLVLYWERTNLSPGEKLSFGVSFPKTYIKSGIHYTGLNWFLYDFLPRYWFILLGGALVAVFSSLMVVNYLRKHPYEKPIVRMETLGIRRGLTAVEASWLLGLGPQKIVVEILYSLLKKHAVWVKEQNPTLRLEAVEPPPGQEDALRYYELSFLRCIGEDGALVEERLAKTVMLVRDNVEEKIRGYCREDTINYYRKIVDEAWQQVKNAGTPELAAKAFDENLLWLILTDDFRSRAGDALGERYMPPDPAWWWYWWWRYPSPHPPVRMPLPDSETGAPLPGADLADKVATSLENASNGMVKNLENFANSVVPAAPKKASREPIRHGSSCACACVSCACVCACVSCACACAGGGAR